MDEVVKHRGGECSGLLLVYLRSRGVFWWYSYIYAPGAEHVGLFLSKVDLACGRGHKFPGAGAYVQRTEHGSELLNATRTA